MAYNDSAPAHRWWAGALHIGEWDLEPVFAEVALSFDSCLTA